MKSRLDVGLFQSESISRYPTSYSISKRKPREEQQKELYRLSQIPIRVFGFDLRTKLAMLPHLLRTAK
jgi:hypothetical protein